MTLAPMKYCSSLGRRSDGMGGDGAEVISVNDDDDDDDDDDEEEEDGDNEEEDDDDDDDEELSV